MAVTFDGTVGEAVIRGGAKLLYPQVLIALSMEVWNHVRSQRKLKADDICDLAAALATEWE